MSVVGGNALKYNTLSTDTPVAGVSVVVVLKKSIEFVEILYRDYKNSLYPFFPLHICNRKIAFMYCQQWISPNQSLSIKLTDKDFFQIARLRKICRSLAIPWLSYLFVD